MLPCRKYRPTVDRCRAPIPLLWRMYRANTSSHKTVNPTDVRTDWEDYADSQAEEHERASAQFNSSPGGCRYLVHCLSEELAMADRMLQHPALGPAVAPMYQWVVGPAALSFARQRIELM